MRDNALLFIPDISGFSNFVSETDVEHSGHIISELLEVIIDTNEMGMEISEIEGDAVLFFRIGEPPTLQQLLAQSKRMFLKFHQYLKQFERDRICECGACTTANRLTLKVFAHYGWVTKVKVKHFHKLHGENLIVAHRLMKNNVNSDEYLLLTQDYLSAAGNENLSPDEDWFKLSMGQENYPEIGNVDFGFSLLAPLRKFITDAPPRATPNRVSNPIAKEILIKAPFKKIYDIIADAQNKLKLGAKQVIMDDARVPRLGSKHTCVLPTGVLKFETIENKVADDELEFAEKVENLPVLGTANFVYLLTRENSNTIKLTLELHHEPSGFWSNVKYTMALLPMTFMMNKMLCSIQNVAEAS